VTTQDANGDLHAQDGKYAGRANSRPAAALSGHRVPAAVLESETCPATAQDRARAAAASRMGIADRSTAEIAWQMMVAGPGLDDEKFTQETVDRAASDALRGVAGRLLPQDTATIGLLHARIDGGRRLRPVGYTPVGGQPTLLENDAAPLLDEILSQYQSAGYDSRAIPGVRALPGSGDGYELVLKEG